MPKAETCTALFWPTPGFKETDVERGSARQSSWKDEKGPSSISRTLDLFQRHRWGNSRETGWSAYGFFRAHRYHLKLKWTLKREARTALAAKLRGCVSQSSGAVWVSAQELCESEFRSCANQNSGAVWIRVQELCESELRSCLNQNSGAVWIRAQDLCESELSSCVNQSSKRVWKSRWTSWAPLPVPNSPYGLCGREATLNNKHLLSSLQRIKT